MTNLMEEREKRSKGKLSDSFHLRNVNQWTRRVTQLGILLFGWLMLAWMLLVMAPWTDAVYKGFSEAGSPSESLSLAVAYAVGLTMAWAGSIMIISRFIRRRDGENRWMKGMGWVLIFGVVTLAFGIPTHALVDSAVSAAADWGTAGAIALTYFLFALLAYLAFMIGRFWGPLSPSEISTGPPERD